MRGLNIPRFALGGRFGPSIRIEQASRTRTQSHTFHHDPRIRSASTSSIHTTSRVVRTLRPNHFDHRTQTVPARWNSSSIPRKAPQTTQTQNVARPAPAQKSDALDPNAQIPAPAERQKMEEELDDEEELDFGRSDKANAAAQLNLSAKLSKESSKSNKRPAFGEVWRLLKIAGPEMKTLSGAFSLLLISSSISLSIPWAIGKIMDIANQEGATQITLFGVEPAVFYTGFGALLLLGASANFGRVILLRIVGERIVAGLRSSLYRRTMMQNAEFFDANRVGDLLSRLGSDTTIVGKAITQNLSDGLRAMVSGGAGVAMMTWTSPHLTSVLLFMLPPFAACAYFFGRAIRNLSRVVQRNLGTLTKIAEERLGNVKTTQAFVGEGPELGRYNKQVKKIFTLGRKDALLNASFFGTSGFLGNMTILALLYVGGGMVQSGAITVGQLSSFLLYAGFAGSSLFGLSGFFSELMKGSGAASRIFELQDREPSIYPTAGQAVRSARGAIEFKHVAFSYPTRPAVSIFKDLNFRITEGSNVAIVAPSGAGKSTVAQLLLRFYNPNTGEITIDGKDISSMNAKQLRRRIGYVGQEPVLFSGSVADNIAYGRPSASRLEIVQAARKANCHFISDFPDGLDTQVGARGTQLSGGQKQRIAIARALLKNPDILILDEATSALDAESESLVNQALVALLRGNNTTISIAHRLSTIKRSDRIIVIGNDGCVSEEGSYTELSNNKDGPFNQLMQWQLSGDVEPPRRIEPKPSPQEEIEYDLESESELEAGEGEEVKEDQKDSAAKARDPTA